MNSAGQVHINYRWTEKAIISSRKLRCFFVFASDAHDFAVNKILNVSDNLIATGDDGGVVKLWDPRVGSTEVKSWDWHEDFVSGLCYREDKSTLLSIAGESFLVGLSAVGAIACYVCAMNVFKYSWVQ